MQQWEYITIELQGIGEKKVWREKVTNWDAAYFSQQVNQYGTQGWELVSCFDTIKPVGYASTTSGVFAMFKRKKES